MKETEIIRSFYDAFQKLDAETMVQQYHPDVRFEDPAFGELHGERARNMWRMLCASQKGKDFRVEHTDIRCIDGKGEASWIARYYFGATGKPVINKIRASFRFKDGKIVEHIDDFDLHNWASQAMGWKGWLLGWTGFFKKQLQARTSAMLEKFEKKPGQ